MLLVLTLLSPVLLAALLFAADRIERRLDEPSGGARRAPQPTPLATPHLRDVFGDEPTDRREDGDRHLGGVGGLYALGGENAR